MDVTCDIDTFKNALSVYQGILVDSKSRSFKDLHAWTFQPIWFTSILAASVPVLARPSNPTQSWIHVYRCRILTSFHIILPFLLLRKLTCFLYYVDHLLPIESYETSDLFIYFSLF